MLEKNSNYLNELADGRPSSTSRGPLVFYEQQLDWEVIEVNLTVLPSKEIRSTNRQLKSHFQSQNPYESLNFFHFLFEGLNGTFEKILEKALHCGNDVSALKDWGIRVRNCTHFSLRSKR